MWAKTIASLPEMAIVIARETYWNLISVSIAILDENRMGWVSFCWEKANCWWLKANLNGHLTIEKENGHAMSQYPKFSNNSGHVTTHHRQDFAVATLQNNLAQGKHKSTPTHWLLYLGLLRQEILLSPLICDRLLRPKSTPSSSHTSQVL